MQAVDQKAQDITRETEARLALERELDEQRKVEAQVRAQLTAAAEEKERLFKMVSRLVSPAGGGCGFGVAVEVFWLTLAAPHLLPVG